MIEFVHKEYKHLNNLGFYTWSEGRFSSFNWKIEMASYLSGYTMHGWTVACISASAVIWNRIWRHNRLGHLTVSWSLAQNFNNYCIITVLEEVHWKYSHLLMYSHVNNDYGYQVAKLGLTLPAKWIRLSFFFFFWTWRILSTSDF